MGNLVIENLTKRFKKDDSEILVLDDISLSVKNGEFVTILGPSGSGKTTLLRIIAGLETYSSGTAFLDGEVISGPGSKRGVVFQEYSLFPWKTVLGNVMFGPRMQGFSKKEAEAKAVAYLTLVGLSDFKNSYPFELSGGMKQRVAIARALANEPVKRFVEANPVTVPAYTTVDRMIENYIYKYNINLYPVVGNCKLKCVSVDDVKRVPRRDWTSHSVDEYAKPCSSDNSVLDSENAMKALTVMNRTGNTSIMVVTPNGELVGTVNQKDLMRFMALKMNFPEK